MVPAIGRRAEDGGGERETAQVRVDDEEVGEAFGDAFDDFVVVGFG